MILFTILATIALIVLVFGIATLAAGGAAMTIIFGDLIVCVFIILLVMKLIFRKK